MANDPSKHAADRKRIDVSQDYECRYWSERFKVTMIVTAIISPASSQPAAIQRPPKTIQRTFNSRSSKVLASRTTTVFVACATGCHP